MSKPLFFILVAVAIFVLTIALTMYQVRYDETSSLVVPDFIVAKALVFENMTNNTIMADDLFIISLPE